MGTTNTERHCDGRPVLGSSVTAAIDEVVADLAVVRERAHRVMVRSEELERALRDAQRAERDMAEQLVASQEHAARVMALYVATYQLHASLDPADVRGTIAEITINLLGAERFVLLLRGASRGVCQVALGEGLEDDTTGLFSGGVYVGGDTMIDATLADGVLRIESDLTLPVLAVVPLVAQDELVGALVVLKLLGHRGSLEAHDRELLDLLGAHAASALLVAQVHANADRKLKTLESLVRLAQRT